MSLRIGIDIGSTTVKVVLLDEQNKLLFRSYERHYSKARERAAETLRSLADRLAGRQVRIVITGSAGLGVAKAAEIDFVQEVYATAAAVNQYIPDTDAVIELGGEDAKIIFFGGALEERMNGSCAGGTGAFIDQMATLMNVTVNELDELSLRHEKIYPIASRCGVFAKSDIQPILNQGGRTRYSCIYCFKRILQLGNHTSLNNAISYILFKFDTGDLGNHTVVIILVTQHAFLLKTIYQCHIKQGRQRFRRFSGNGICIRVQHIAVSVMRQWSHYRNHSLMYQIG